jgi:hypothetical protein
MKARASWERRYCGNVMQIGSLRLDSKVCLAPMAGVTDLRFG